VCKNCQRKYFSYSVRGGDDAQIRDREKEDAWKRTGSIEWPRLKANNVFTRDGPRGGPPVWKRRPTTKQPTIVALHPNVLSRALQYISYREFVTTCEYDTE